MEKKNEPTPNNPQATEQGGQAEPGAGATLDTTNPTVHHLGSGQDTEDYREKLKTWVPVVGLVIALFAAIASAFSACSSLRVLNANIARDRLDQRAWMSIAEIHLEKVPTAGEEILYLIKMQNTGKTPALRVSNRIRYRTAAPKNFDDFVFKSKEEDGRAVPPGGTPYLTFFRISEKEDLLNETEVAAVMDGTLPLYLFGVIRYDDVFGKHHFTRFCTYYVYDKTAPTLPDLCKQKDYNYME